MAALEFSTEIIAREQGGWEVRRLCHGVLVERFVTYQLHIARKGGEQWKQQVAEWAAMPKTPPPGEPAHWVAWREYVAQENVHV